MKTLYLRNLRYWSIHVTLCSTPSFILAILGGYTHPESIGAIVTGILFFIFGYAALTSSSVYLRFTDGMLGEAARLAVKVRAWLSVISLICLGAGGIFFVPDFYIGLFAMSIINCIGEIVSQFWPSITPASSNIWLGSLNAYFPTLATVVLEGVLLSMGLFVIAWIIALTWRQHLKFS